MSIWEHGLLFCVALFANLLSSLAGGGAGLLQLPALLFLGLPFAQALATHKVATVALGLGATARHLQQGQLDWRFSLWILAWGLPGVVIGARSILLIPESWAQASLGVLTLSLGLYSWSQAQLGQHAQPRHRQGRQQILGGVILAVIGILNGSLTSGTGLFVTLWLVIWYGLDYRQAVAYTLILVGLFWNATGALTLGLSGNINWAWLPALLVGSLLGGFLGAHLSIVQGNRLVKRCFEITTITVGGKLLLDQWWLS